MGSVTLLARIFSEKKSMMVAAPQTVTGSWDDTCETWDRAPGQRQPTQPDR